MDDLARRHQIHGVQPVLPVPDVATAVDWFCRTLGFALDFVLGEPPEYARVKLGDRSWGDPVYIHLRATAETLRAGGSEIRLHAAHDIDALFQHVRAGGAEIMEPPTDRPWGLREFIVLAPGGHEIVIGQPLDEPLPEARPRAVIAAYRPRPGCDEALEQLVRAHVPGLQRMGLATDRAALIMRAADGTLVEAFEWASAAAIDTAHRHPEVQAMWERFDTLCEHRCLKDLAEAQGLFAEFTSV
jgi:uncharacterized glyoxalase superfamily protein PhnB/quinol monooxygenase YgiN